MPSKKTSFIPANEIERAKEIARLRALLASNKKFTASEIASIRGKIGGLAGKGSPGRRKGGLAGSAVRWKSTHKKTKNCERLG